MGDVVSCWEIPNCDSNSSCDFRVFCGCFSVFAHSLVILCGMSKKLSFGMMTRIVRGMHIGFVKLRN